MIDFQSGVRSGEHHVMADCSLAWYIAFVCDAKRLYATRVFLPGVQLAGAMGLR